MTPPTRAQLEALIAKWRTESDGVQAMGYSQQADRMRDCADELAAALAPAPEPAPPAPADLVALVRALQQAMRSFEGWTRAGMPQTADSFEDRARRAMDALLAYELPAAAPRVPERDMPGCINCGETDDGGFYTDEGRVGSFCEQCWEFLRDEFAPPTTPQEPTR